MLDTSVRIPRFLPFPGAVKALAESLGLCALLAATSCVSRGVEHGSLGPPTGPVRQAPTSVPEPEAPQGDSSAPTNAAPTPESAPSTELTIEEPYPIDARPRAASALQAAADDEELARWNVGGTADPNYVSSQTSFHPGTRVVVDAHLPGQRRKSAATPRPNARGLSAERVEAQARAKGYWPFRLCFEAGQREKKGLGGETRVRFTIGSRGNVSAARLISSELKSSTSAGCLVNELRKIHFAPAPVRRMDIVTSIRIWPGDAELPAISDAPLGAVDTSNGFDPAAVRARVTSKQAALAACFAEARLADPSLWGRLAFAIVLEVDGSVHRVSEVESHFPNAAAARCAAAQISTIPFPSVNGKPFSLVLAIRLPPTLATQAGATKPARRTEDQEPAAPPDGGESAPAD